MFMNMIPDRRRILNSAAVLVLGVASMTISGAALAETVCGANVNDGGASITIENNLADDLTFKKTKNRQNIEIWSDPPKTVEAGGSGCFVVAPGDSGKNRHLNIQYSIDGTSDDVGVVFKDDVGSDDKHCPKDHPNWVTEDVKNCGHWDDISDGELWTYIYSPN